MLFHWFLIKKIRVLYVNNRRQNNEILKISVKVLHVESETEF